MLLLCQRSEEYNQFMLAKLTGAAAGAGSPKADTAALENGFRSGQFNVTVRELIAYYINLVRSCYARQDASTDQLCVKNMYLRWVALMRTGFYGALGTASMNGTQMKGRL